MQGYLAQQNITRFKEQIRLEIDPIKLATLRKLLVEQETILASLRPESEPPATKPEPPEAAAI